MRFVLLAALAGLAVAATPASAEGICSGKAAPADSLDRLAKRLNLTDAQKASLKDLQDASAASAASAKTALCDAKPDLTTAPGRIAFSEKMAQAQVDGIKAIQPKLDAFYATLDDKQKKALMADSPSEAPVRRARCRQSFQRGPAKL
jgi:hypothetical protein